MKKRLLSLVILALSISAFAQTGSKHLTFKGVSVEGNYEQFSQSLIKKGFVCRSSGAEAIVLSGNFMTYSDTQVIIYPYPTNQNVAMVVAMIDAGDKWPDIEKKYYSVIAAYKDKYGEPTKHVEEFSETVGDIDFLRLYALEEGKCKYESEWQRPEGKILIAILYSAPSNYVVCYYVDCDYDNAVRKAMIDDI